MQGSDKQPSVQQARRTEQATALGPRAFDISQLPQRPKVVPLERTNCVINLNEISLVDLVKKIDECSRRLSLQRMHWIQPIHGEPARALLLSEDYVWIKVFIWRAGEHSVTVEIQRRDGDCFMYDLFAQQLLNGVHGELPKISEKVDDIPHIKHLMQTEKAMHAYAAGRDLPGTTQGVWVSPTANLFMVYRFLMSNGPDNPQRTGLEILVGLTNPRNASIAFSVLFSRVMLIGTTAPGIVSKEAREMQIVMLDIIQHRQVTFAEFTEIWGMPPEFLEMGSPACTSSGMRIMVMLALTVLDHCLETCLALEPYESDSAACMPALLVDAFLWHANALTSVNLVVTLLTDIGKASENAHIARVATSCLRRICMASETALQDTMRLGGKTIVEKAHAIGKSSHANLEWECKQFLRVLLV